MKQLKHKVMRVYKLVNKNQNKINFIYDISF